MSLESEIAILSSEARGLLNYYNTKKAGIESAVNAAIAAVPETTRDWYVDPVIGLDTNAGTLAAPFKTIERAIAATPSAGLCNIYLLKDYDLSRQVNCTCAVVVVSGATGVEVLRVKYFTQLSDPANPQSPLETRLGGFALQRQASNIELRGLTISLPSPTGVAPTVVSNRMNSFLRTYGSFSVPPLMGIQMNAVTVQKAADFVGYLVSAPSSCVALGCGAVSFPSDFAGRYIDGIAAGTDTKTLTRILTNLATL